MRRVTMAIFVLGMLVAAPVAVAQVLPPGGTFLDDDATVHEGAIEAIALGGITAGCNPPQNDLFCPDEPVSRGQMAAFMRRALGDELAPGAPASFTDDDGSVFEGDIEWLASVGVTKGCNPPANTEFCPADPVTRAQMAAFLVRAFGYADGAGADQFTDDDGSVFESDIERMAAAGVTLGCNPPDNTRFCPGEPVQRGQMASFLTRALDLDPLPPPPRSTTSTSTTTTTTAAPDCHPSYPDFCIPPPPPQLNCDDVSGSHFTVIGEDPHNFDGNGDGVGCQTD
jgi:hypothetical protein